jgi:SAM-dependent methyltransferase
VEYNGKKIYQHVAMAENFNFHEDRQFDLIVCRQAVNYLNIKEAFKNVADHLLSDGRFVFNTFTTSKRFVSKEYRIDGRDYRETSVKLFNSIIHVQRMFDSKLGSQLDLTVFKYIDRDEFFDALLGAGFKSVRMIIEGNSAYYICVKNEVAA